MGRVPELPPLVRAAQDLETAIRECEETVAEAGKIKLNSEKNIARAARALQASNEFREAMAGKVNALLPAINAARERAEGAAARINARGTEIQARMERMKAFQMRGAEIAEAVRQVTELAKSGKPKAEILAALGPAEKRVAEAHREAQAEEFEDVVRATDSMQKMLAELRKKLS